MHPRFQRLLDSTGFSIGLELPLDNDMPVYGPKFGDAAQVFETEHRDEWDCDGKSGATNPTSASFTWIWQRILMHRCNVYVLAAAAGGWH
jgi:hypothetical protein